MTTLQLADDADRQIAGYSHGMRKKTSLAAALLHRPRLLLLDEPFEGVDPVSARTMRSMLDRFRSGGGTVVFSSHVMDLVERLCDHIAVIHQGRVVASGPHRRAARRATPRRRVHRRRRRQRRRRPLAGLARLMPHDRRRRSSGCAGGCSVARSATAAPSRSARSSRRWRRSWSGSAPAPRSCSPAGRATTPTISPCCSARCCSSRSSDSGSSPASRSRSIRASSRPNRSPIATAPSGCSRRRRSARPASPAGRSASAWLIGMIRDARRRAGRRPRGRPRGCCRCCSSRGPRPTCWRC